MLERMTECHRMSEYMSDRMPERMLEYIECKIECQNTCQNICQILSDRMPVDGDHSKKAIVYPWFEF